MSAADVTQELDLLREAAEAAFRDVNGRDEVRRLLFEPDGWSRATWRGLATELGLPGMALPMDVGGAGLTTVQVAEVMEQAGASLLCAPLLSTAGLAVTYLLAANDASALGEFGPDICSGDTIATVALVDPERRSAAQPETTARLHHGRWLVTGRKAAVIDGATADLVLVVAATSDGPGLFAVESAGALLRESQGSLDLTRRLAEIEFHATEVRLVGELGERRLRDAADAARVLLAAEQVGGAQRCLDMSVDYAKTRYQFARPIGSFQAIKHRLADMLIQVESSRSAVWAAARSVSAASPDAHRDALAASHTASAAYRFVAGQGIQLHGGIGFTWEHDAHLHYKRAISSAKLLESESDRVEALSRILESEIE